jgi:O-antigen/teichoic acid export membrane protein
MVSCVAGIAAYAASQWLLMVIIARLGGVAMLGQYAFCQAVAFPVMMICRLGLRPILATDFRQAYAPSDVLTLSVVGGGAGIMTVMLLSGLATAVSASGVLPVLLAITMAFEGIADVFHGVFDRRGQFTTGASLLIARSLTSLLAFLIAIVFSGSLVTAAFVRAAVTASVVLMIEIPLAVGRQADGDPSLMPRWNPPALAHLLRQALPAALTSYALAVETSIPRWVLGGTIGASSLGTFAAIAQISQFSQLIQAAFLQASLSHLTRIGDISQLSHIRQRCMKMLPTATVLGLLYLIAVIMLGGPLLAVVYGGVIRIQDAFVPLALLAVADTARLVALPPMALIRGLRKWWPMFLIRLAATIAMACLALTLTPAFTVNGIALATIGAGVTTAGLSFLVLWCITASSVPSHSPSIIQPRSECQAAAADRWRGAA